MKNDFPYIIDTMVNETKQKIEDAMKKEDWGRVLRLEGFVNGLQQAHIIYQISHKEGD